VLSLLALIVPLPVFQSGLAAAAELSRCILHNRRALLVLRLLVISILSFVLLALLLSTHSCTLALSAQYGIGVGLHSAAAVGHGLKRHYRIR